VGSWLAGWLAARYFPGQNKIKSFIPCKGQTTVSQPQSG